MSNICVCWHGLMFRNLQAGRGYAEGTAVRLEDITIREYLAVVRDLEEAAEEYAEKIKA